MTLNLPEIGNIVRGVLTKLRKREVSKTQAEKEEWQRYWKRYQRMSEKMQELRESMWPEIDWSAGNEF